jgi:succinyl-CoA synthetase beta subunit
MKQAGNDIFRAAHPETPRRAFQDGNQVGLYLHHTSTIHGTRTMNFTESAAKPLLRDVGIAIPRGQIATSAREARDAASAIGACVVKAQVPTGKRGKAGGIKLAATADEAEAHANAILGMNIGEHPVESVLVEEQMPIAREMYADVLNDPASKSTMVMFSAVGGMDIEEIAEQSPDALRRAVVDVRHGFSADDARALLDGADLGDCHEDVVNTLTNLYQAYADNDAELMEVNPLCIMTDARVVALDCKYTLDDSAVKRREALSASGTPDRVTALEARGQELGLKYIELDGDIGVLANGAGLTMTTMDVITHLGGSPANFLEIGGEAYTKATPGLKLVLDNPRVKSLVVNFCGAFARTDVMTEGVLNAMDELKPTLPFFFCIHGTGAAEARAMLKERQGVDAYATMDEAIAAAIAAAR